MQTHWSRYLAAFLLLVLAVAAPGCSRVSILYNSADFLIERYARDYLGLKDPQVSTWVPELERALDRHRREDLPYLARFFDSAYEGATKGFDQAQMNCLLDQFEVLYGRHMTLAVELASPLLAELSPDQVKRLADKFREEAEDTVDLAPASVRRRNRKRAERYQESIAWWTGPLSPAQIEIIREEAAAIPDTESDWSSYQNTKRRRLIELLESDTDEAEIRKFLGAWLIEHRDLPDSLRQAKAKIRERITALFLRLDASFDGTQRAHFARRLASLRDDFLKLQRRPRLAIVPCVAFRSDPGATAKLAR